MFRIYQYRKELEELLDFKEIPERIICGLSWTEGPVWDNREGSLYFTDFPSNRIYRWSKSDGLHIFREHSDSACGLAFDQKGRLLCAEAVSRSVTRLERNGHISILAQKWKGKYLNSPNDIIVKSDGSIYFTDPYSPDVGNKKETKENGIYRISQQGEVKLLADMNRPNGLTFSPDEKYLYIDDTNEQLIRRFQLKEDGTLTDMGIFAKMEDSWGNGAADGMKADEKGNLFVTGPGGITIWNPLGKVMGRIEFPEIAANLCFGGKNRRQLFVTAQTSVYVLRVKTKGAADSSQRLWG